jgi:glycine/D-amino acid oxidase-like deaminating enzyme
MTPPAPETLQCDTLVVGDGAPGEDAARAAASAGEDVVLLDERPTSPDPPVPRAYAGALAWGAWRETGLLVTASQGNRKLHIRANRLVLALRGFEPPMPIPGWTLPGVLSIDAARAQPIHPGQRVVLAGTGRELSAFATELAAAGVEIAAVLDEAGVIACTGADRFEALLARDGGGQRQIAADLCVLSRGRRPETALARLLGVATHDGAVVADAEGRTSQPDVFVLPLQPLPPPPPPWRGPIADEVIACRCEGVTAGAIRALGVSARAAKRATRAGMGACGGRLCADIMAQLCNEPDPLWDTPRAPVRLVPAAAILQERPEPHPPLWDAQDPPALPPTIRAAPPTTADIAIIGGGVVGLATALFLAREGRDILVLDRAEPGQAASSANAGSLHVQLLPYTFSAADPGPLASILTLGPASIALWEQIERESGADLGIRRNGGLVLARDPSDLALLERKAAYERSRGVAVEVIGPADIARIAPALAPAHGAAWCAAEGQIDPLRATPALLALARAAGARVLAHRAPLSLAREGAVWRIATNGGEIRAGQVVNCAGVGAASVARLAGISLPVRTVVQQVIATARTAAVHLPLIAVAGRHLSLKQNHGGQLLVGGGWPGALQPDGRAHLLRASVEGNLALAAAVLPMLAGVDIVRAWATATVHLDRGPVLAETPGQPGLFHAVVSNGYTLGPGVGRVVADAVLGRERLAAAFGLA